MVQYRRGESAKTFIVRIGSPIYYGWFVLAAGAISEMLAQGATSYSAGLFVLPLQTEFHLSRADAGSAVLILFAGSALVSPFIGRILDRYSIRLVMTAGALLFALSMAAIAAAHSIWVMVLLLFLPAAAGFMAIGPLTTATLASRWFHRRRGLALGLAAVATSGGGFLAPIISVVIARHGWREGLSYEAFGLCAIIVVLALLIVRDSPAAQAFGAHPENVDCRTGAHSAGWRDVLLTGNFWIPSLTLAAISGASQADRDLVGSLCCRARPFRQRCGAAYHRLRRCCSGDKDLGRPAGRPHRAAPASGICGIANDTVMAGTESVIAICRSGIRQLSCGNRTGLRPAHGNSLDRGAIRCGKFRPRDGHHLSSYPDARHRGGPVQWLYL